MNVHEQKELMEKVHNQPLFKGVSNETFLQLMDDCELQYYRKSEKIPYSKHPHEGLLLILKGSAEVLVEAENGRWEVLEVLQEGELFGFSTLAYFLGEPDEPVGQHEVEVEAVNHSYCLQIPYSVIRRRWEDEFVRDYMLRQVALRLREIYSSLAEQVKLAGEWGESEPFVRRAQDLMQAPAFTVDEDETVQNIARKMVNHSIGTMLVVDKKEHLLGIVTEKDIVERVVAGTFTIPPKAKDIMTNKIYTVSRHDYYYEVLSMFYTTGVKNLPVVEGEKVVGIVTLSNLIAKRNRGAMGVIKKIEDSSFENLPQVKHAIYDVLSSLIHDEISTIQTLGIITKLYDRLAYHCVNLAVKSLEQKGKGTPPVPFCLYQMGSGARGEQFMLTDQDHFLVYADSEKNNKGEIKQYFSLLGQEIVHHLEQAGYALCKGKMMSSEQVWRGSLLEWKRRLHLWALKLKDEHILLGHNFLSFRFLYGNHSLNGQFVDLVQGQLEKSRTFIYYMAQQEREKLVPQFDQPFGILFKGKRQVIDIKKHALFPLHHCLQILGVHNGLIEGTTIELLNELVKKGELSEGFADDLHHAYEVALRTRIQMSWRKHLRNEEITTEIKLSSIRTWEKDELITMLKTVRSLQFYLLSKL
ncbi:DUF294 nucleotidyltransferase-like domain-containing protein [Peribacillus asahii]|uniref:DUF294 nucleotidyltransferase-like domain-containing protein n=1 Tax=Peribacillus asahii TaxID=228899 RepID=UPI0020793853|nr:DUF294 nucleotidyltransferase-like domain-containing protein [Peribacillus asahii]USK86014.1 DUF294 nucleotidyltransferase-like domain-containing protein [Peribacillus asahii]